MDSRFQPTLNESQDRDSRQEPTKRQQTMEEYWLVPSRTTQNHLPSSGTAHIGPSFPKSIVKSSNHESVALTCPEAGLVEGILHLGTLLPGDSCLCHVDKNQPAHTTFSATHMTLVGSCRDSENSTSPVWGRTPKVYNRECRFHLTGVAE